MPAAIQAFTTALVDVANILRFHGEIGGDGPGKRSSDLASLNKSGIVLLCATWELYVESVIVECTELHLSRIEKPDALLNSLSKLVNASLRDEKDDRAWHRVASDGWKDIVREVVKKKVGELNTPKTKNISSLFEVTLGIKNIQSCWKWHKNEPVGVAIQLDKFVTLRGRIAHGDHQSANINKNNVTWYKTFVERLVDCTETKVFDTTFSNSIV